MRTLIFVAILFCSCLCDDGITELQKSFAAISNALFGFDILKELNHETANVFFSPYSVWTALVMTSLAASNNTLQQIEELCHFSIAKDDDDPEIIYKAIKSNIEYYNQPNPNYVLSMANRLYGREGFEIKETFQEKCRNYFHAELQKLDFGAGTAEEIINQWVADQTRNKIRNLFEPGSISDDALLIIVNALYLKANWSSQFETWNTDPGVFHSSDNSEKNVQMMKQTRRFKYVHDNALHVKLLKLPFVNSNLSMLIFLPDAQNGLFQFINNFTLENCGDLYNRLEETLIHIGLPKFTLEMEYDLKNVLGNLDLFNDNANLSRLSDTSTKVSKVIHKTFLDVNEKGTEAAAITGIEFVRTSGQIPNPNIEQFIVDHPFHFMIVDESTKLLLFVGNVNKL